MYTCAAFYNSVLLLQLAKQANANQFDQDITSDFCPADSAGYVKLHGAYPAVDSAVGRIKEAAFDPVFTLMVAFDTPLSTPFDAAVVSGGSGFQWLACDSSKPGDGVRWGEGGRYS